MAVRRTHPITLVCLAIGLVFLVAEVATSLWGPGWSRLPYGRMFSMANALEAALWVIIGIVLWV